MDTFFEYRYLVLHQKSRISKIRFFEDQARQREIQKWVEVFHWSLSQAYDLIFKTSMIFSKDFIVPEFYNYYNELNNTLLQYKIELKYKIKIKMSLRVKSDEIINFKNPYEVMHIWSLYDKGPILKAI